MEPRTRIDDWKTEEGKVLLRKYMREAKNNDELADKIGISRSTFYEWKKDPDFSDNLKKDREIINGEAEDALIQLFGGQYVEDVRTEVWEENGKVTKRHVLKNKRWVPPNVTAIIFYLKAKAGWTENAIAESKTGEYLESLQSLMRGDL